MGEDVGDTLGYSAAFGDLDQDGLDGLILNEMVGNGIGPGRMDVGNLIVLSGAAVAEKKTGSIAPTSDKPRHHRSNHPGSRDCDAMGADLGADESLSRGWAAAR